MNKSIIISLLLVFGYFTHAKAFDDNHAELGNILNQHLTENGKSSTLNYSAIKNSPKKLNDYLSDLSSVKEKQFKSWNKDKQLAFLINAYNAFTIKLIIEHYPIKSIKDIGGIFSNPWKKRFFTLLNKKMHLDEIEHEIIRKRYNEPRIHFALVCASIGCPKLQKAPFTASKLKEQLESAAQDFLTDNSRNRFNEKTNKLEVSSIFKWYGEDFGTQKEMKKFILSKMGKNIDQMITDKIKIEYLDYDWALNDSKKE